MRSFYFTAKNIGKDRYLTYIMGEGTELDEDALDYCEENEMPQIVDILYEEDDDFDYLTYDISGLMTLEKFTGEVINKEVVLKMLRNISLGMISIKECAIPLSYIILNKGVMYGNPDTLNIQFLYLPVEGDASVATEFKGFARQLVAGMRFNVEEDLSYVGQLLTYINGDSFNLRGLIGLTEALMKDSGIGFGETNDISTDDGSEVVDSVDPSVLAAEEKKDIMSELQSTAAEDLPEIGDDEEEEDEVEEIELEEVPEPVKEPEPEPIPNPVPTPVVDDDEEEEEVIHEDGTGITITEPVKVSKAAMLRAAAEAAAEEAEHAAEEESSEDAKNKKGKKDKGEAAEEAAETKKEGGGLLSNITQKGTEIVENTILGSEGAYVINPYLKRVNTDEIIMINKPVFKIGKASRGVDFHVGGNGAISRQHAIILHKGDSYYIKDNKSTNHTYVNGEAVPADEEVLLKDGATITLGDEDFTFKLG